MLKTASSVFMYNNIDKFHDFFFSNIIQFLQSYFYMFLNIYLVAFDPNEKFRVKKVAWNKLVDSNVNGSIYN